MSDSELFPLAPLERPRRSRQPQPKSLRARFYQTFAGFVLSLLQESSAKILCAVELSLLKIRSFYGRLYCVKGIRGTLVRLFKEYPRVFIKRGRKWLLNEGEVNGFIRGQVGEFKRKLRKSQKASTE